MPPSPAIRLPAVAGTFYPADESALRRDLQRYLGPAQSAHPEHGHLKAVIVPHAGYIYSGKTAGHAYAELAPLATTIRRVVLLGPAHRVAVRGLAVPSMQSFKTPLGDISLDREAIDTLTNLPQVVTSDEAHAAEHSLEVQLPFLQLALGEFSLVPLVVGKASTTEVADVINRLWGGEETLIVVSSDLSHYHSYAEAQRIDADTAGHILKLEPLTSFEQACGALPVNGLIDVARQRGLAIERLAQCNSGDTAGDKSRVVGYASFALYEPPASRHTTAPLGAVLLTRARNAIAAHLGQAAQPEIELPALEKPGATFITLTLDGRLRGCIGSLEAYRPLGEDIRANAQAAAFRDPRFPPLSAAELSRIKVEVSLLSTPTPLSFSSEADALRQLRPNIDGVIFVADTRRSTFLPQVWEQLPEPGQFMAHLKQKAGLPADWWSPEVQLYRYEVQKWKE